MTLLSASTNIGCTNFSGIAISDTTKKTKVVQLRCKQWSCAYCAIRNAKQWRASLIDYMNKNTDLYWSFLTFTMPSYIRKESKALRYLSSLTLIKNGWHKLAKRIKRMLGKFEYIRILETHKDGTLHIHLLASVWLPNVRKVTRKDGSVYYYNAEIKKHAIDCGFGYICDHRNLSDDKRTQNEKWNAGGVAGYITKYITKDLAIDDSLRKKFRARKIQTSQGIKRVNLDSDDVWQMKSGIYIEEFDARDKPYHDLSTGHIITREHFRGGVVYPPLFATDDKPII